MKRIAKIIVNWSVMLSIPLWSFFYLWGGIILQIIKGKGKIDLNLLKGDVWFWE